MQIPEYSIKLHKLNCYLPDEATDEIYLKFNGKKLWPKNEAYVSMNEGSVAEVKLATTLLKGASIVVEVWEKDTLSADDKLGRFILEADKIGGPYQSDMIKEDNGKSKYSLEWEVC